MNTETNVDKILIMQSLYDPAVRNQIRDNPTQYALDNGLIAADSPIEVKVVASGRDTMHVPVMHSEDWDNVVLSGEQLSQFQAAGCRPRRGARLHQHHRLRQHGQQRQHAVFNCEFGGLRWHPRQRGYGSLTCVVLAAPS